MHVVASKCSQNHFISEKNKTVQSFKLLFLQICPHVQQYTSACNCKCVGDILGSHFIESLFSFSVALSNMSVASQKHHPFNADFSQGNKYKAGPRSGEYGGCTSVVTLFFAKKCLTKTNQGAGALSPVRIRLLVIYFSGCFLLTASLRDKGCRQTFPHS